MPSDLDRAIRERLAEQRRQRVTAPEEAIVAAPGYAKVILAVLDEHNIGASSAAATCCCGGAGCGFVSGCGCTHDHLLPTLQARTPPPHTGRADMRKIPTLFLRDPLDMRRVAREVHPDCQWVLDGEGVPTRKYDGTCVMFDGERWFARREVKPGKQEPHGFLPVETDETTGKTVGWEPMEQSPFVKFHAEAIEPLMGFGQIIGKPLPEGTYELIGPKINGNPEGCQYHRLETHANAEQFGDVPTDFDGLREYVLGLGREGIEGIVWHHPDGRMAKLKRRDFA